MRILSIETSSRRATVALVDGHHPVTAQASEAEGAHGENLLSLLDAAMESAGWTRASLDRIAVGVGPGSFTGIRVGVALATGLGLGLGRPVLGVGSLAAMAGGVPDGVPGLRCPAVDARRNELFLAVYDEGGRERVAPCTVPRDGLAAWLDLHAPGERVLVGEVLRGLDLPGWFESELTDLPHATPVAWVAAGADPAGALPEPRYVRPPDAVPSAGRLPVSSGERR